MINLHMHTMRCGHAAGTDREYIEAAIRAGYTEFGFSDHSPIAFPEMFQGRPKLDPAAVFAYVNDLRELRDEYKKDALIHIGYETEFYTDIFEDNLKTFREAGIEYLIQGQHFTVTSSGTFPPASVPTDDVRAFRTYLDLLRSGIRSGVFTYIAHPDVINFTGSEELYLTEMRSFLQEVKEAGAVLEFNRLGYYTNRHYPDERFWRIASELKIPAVIGLDAHDPSVYADTDTVKRIREYLASLNIEVREPVIKPL